MQRKIIVITGPTASGKTKLSIDLAHKLDAQIICADSRIVYKDLDIVSAKPTLEEREGVVHHLIDIIDANSDFSAGDFASCAKEIIDNTDKNIIIQGGTWFYIKSLLDDKELIECPSNPSLREELSAFDNNTLWEKLNALDSKRADEIHPNNRDKVIRSIEMCLYLKKPVSSYSRKENKKYDASWYMPKLSRETLYERINKRVDIMMDLGLYQEWQKNKEKYPNSKILQNTIGYKEFFDFESGLYPNIETAVDKIKQHTRNFAKRQLTYFRSRADIASIYDISEIN